MIELKTYTFLQFSSVVQINKRTTKKGEPTFPTLVTLEFKVNYGLQLPGRHVLNKELKNYQEAWNI